MRITNIADDLFAAPQPATPLRWMTSALKAWHRRWEHYKTQEIIAELDPRLARDLGLPPSRSRSWW